MTALSVTPANVIKGANATVEDVLAGVSIAAGQPVYLYSDSTREVRLADSNASAATAQAYGIALHAAAANQPLKIITRGSFTTGATMTAGVFYFVGATAGEIVPYGDLTTADKVCKLFYASSTTVGVLLIEYTGVTL